MGLHLYLDNAQASSFKGIIASLVEPMASHGIPLHGLMDFIVLLFRSEIIHPRSHGAQDTTIVKFALSTLLAVIAITSRKGNKPIVLEYRDGLEHLTSRWLISPRLQRLDGLMR